jgi:hypothetical protein
MRRERHYFKHLSFRTNSGLENGKRTGGELVLSDLRDIHCEVPRKELSVVLA